MIPSATTPTMAPKPATVGMPPTATKTTTPSAPETSRASVGEIAAGNLRAETAKAVDAPEQAAIAPRLRDQETAERSDRRVVDRDSPTGPPPAFEESPLERQARVALDPPEAPGETVVSSKAPPAQTNAGEDGPKPSAEEIKDIDPPPTPRERAEVSFAETRTLSEPREPASLDVSR